MFDRLGRLVAMTSVAALVGCGANADEPAPPPPTSPPPSPVRVMTWNLQRGQAVAGRFAQADMAPFAARLAEDRVDIAGLQEVTRDEAFAIAGILGWPGPQYVETKNPCPGFPEPVPAACAPFGNAILSRHPLGPARTWTLPPSGLEASFEGRVLVRSVADADDGAIAVYVTHLAANATRAEREAQADAVLAAIDEDTVAADIVLVGDFNAEPTDDVVTTLTARFADAWATRGEDEPGFTSNAVLGVTRRIDYVLVGRGGGLAVADVTVDTTPLSDHLAVVAELVRQ